MITAEGLGYSINGQTLLRGIDLALSVGRLTVVIGPNGAGKSTLLRLLTGELKATEGRVTVGGEDMRQLPAGALARMRAVVPQHTVLAFPFSVAEVVELGVTVPGLMAAGHRARRLAYSMLERVGLHALAERTYPSLSGGERQRVHIARALAQLEASDLVEMGRGAARSAMTLLVDEPTSSLDIGHQLAVLDELRKQAGSGRAVLAVLHDLNLAAAHADEILLLADGRQLARGRPTDVLTEPLLSKAYGCEIRLNSVPAENVPFILPQSCRLQASAALI